MLFMILAIPLTKGETIAVWSRQVESMSTTVSFGSSEAVRVTETLGLLIATSSRCRGAAGAVRCVTDTTLDPVDEVGVPIADETTDLDEGGASTLRAHV